MEPDRTLTIKMCGRCGSTHFALDYYHKAKIKGDFHFLWESDGFFIRPRCADCGNSPEHRWFDKVEDAIVFWNEEL